MTHRLAIVGGEAVFPVKETVERCDVVTEGDTIARVEPTHPDETADVETIDATGLCVAPGFIDLQVNGGFGADFSNADPSGLRQASQKLARHGVTSFLPTLITASIDEMRAAMSAVNDTNLSSILGVHLEGPFISPDKRGTHNATDIQTPSLETLEQLTDGFEDLIALVTLAPELPSAHELMTSIEKFAVPAVGHSNATFAETKAAFEAGAPMVTHLFNAMSGLHHREPGVVGAALVADVMAGLIVDGVHVHPDVVDLTVRCKGIEKLCLISDAISATGMGDGRWPLGDLTIEVTDDVARNSAGRLAGSVLTLDRAVANLMRFADASLPEAVRAVTHNPARLLGLDHCKGDLKPGMDADLVVFDRDLTVHYAVSGGEVTFAR